MFPPTLADSDRQSTTARIVGGLLIVVVCVSIVAATLMNARGWYRGYKTWRSDSLVKKSEEFEKAEKMSEAVMQANQAYVQDPENPNAIRALARYATMMRRNESRFLWGKLRKQDAMTDDDIQWEIQALSYLNEDKAVITEIEKVLRERKPTKKIVQIADQVMQKLGRKEQLLDLLRLYTEQEPDDQDIRLMLAVREVQFGTTSDVEKGKATLWEVAQNKEKTGLQAIEVLDKLKLPDEADQKRLIDLLNQHPLAEEEHRIAALRRLAALEPSRKTEIIDQAMKDRANAKREDLVPLARWLTLEGESEKLIAFLKEDMVLNFTPLLENYLNALTLLKRYDDLARVINDPKTRLTTAERAFHKVHLAFVTSKSWDDVNSLLNDALAAAQSEGKPNMVMSIARYAEQREHPIVAEQAYLAITRIPQSRVGGLEREGFESLLRLSYQNGNSKSFMETAQETARRWPDNQNFSERAVYSSLLAGMELEGSIIRARKLLEDKPNDSQRKLIMALAYSRQLDPKSAAKHLQQINLSDISLGQGAVLCGIMKSAGFEQQAQNIASQIPNTTKMLPEEERFLKLAKPSTDES